MRNQNRTDNKKKTILISSIIASQLCTCIIAAPLPKNFNSDNGNDSNKSDNKNSDYNLSAVDEALRVNHCLTSGADCLDGDAQKEANQYASDILNTIEDTSDHSREAVDFKNALFYGIDTRHDTSDDNPDSYINDNQSQIDILNKLKTDGLINIDDLQSQKEQERKQQDGSSDLLGNTYVLVSDQGNSWKKRNIDDHVGFDQFVKREADLLTKRRFWSTLAGTAAGGFAGGALLGAYNDHEQGEKETKSENERLHNEVDQLKAQRENDQRLNGGRDQRQYDEYNGPSRYDGYSGYRNDYYPNTYRNRDDYRYDARYSSNNKREENIPIIRGSSESQLVKRQVLGRQGALSLGGLGTNAIWSSVNNQGKYYKREIGVKKRDIESANEDISKREITPAPALVARQDPGVGGSAAHSTTPTPPPPPPAGGSHPAPPPTTPAHTTAPTAGHATPPAAEVAPAKKGMSTGGKIGIAAGIAGAGTLLWSMFGSKSSPPAPPAPQMAAAQPAATTPAATTPVSAPVTAPIAAPAPVYAPSPAPVPAYDPSLAYAQGPPPVAYPAYDPYAAAYASSPPPASMYASDPYAAYGQAPAPYPPMGAGYPQQPQFQQYGAPQPMPNSHYMARSDRQSSVDQQYMHDAGSQQQYQNGYPMNDNNQLGSQDASQDGNWSGKQRDYQSNDRIDNGRSGQIEYQYDSEMYGQSGNQDEKGTRKNNEGTDQPSTQSVNSQIDGQRGKQFNKNQDSQVYDQGYSQIDRQQGNQYDSQVSTQLASDSRENRVYSLSENQSDRQQNTQWSGDRSDTRVKNQVANQKSSDWKGNQYDNQVNTRLGSSDSISQGNRQLGYQVDGQMSNYDASTDPSAAYLSGDLNSYTSADSTYSNNDSVPSRSTGTIINTQGFTINQ